MKKQMTKIAIILVLVIGLTAGAANAQVDNGGLHSVGVYSGIETAEGTCEAVSTMCYGNTFVLDSYGEWETYHLTVSLNYLGIPNHNGSGMGITGGTWSLLVYREGAYAGTLYGKVQEGSLSIITDSKGEEVSKQVQANLNSTGGSGMFKGKEYENISAAYTALIDLRSKETSGGASFSF